jgi:hypothetical protein
MEEKKKRKQVVHGLKITGIKSALLSIQRERESKNVKLEVFKVL